MSEGLKVVSVVVTAVAAADKMVIGIQKVYLLNNKLFHLILLFVRIYR